MADFRTKRARKSVDYSKFARGVSDDDDDFADSTPPPSKKVKKSQAPKPEKQQKTDTKRVELKLKNAREASDNKKFEEDLQFALALSATSPVDAPSTNNTQNSDSEPGGQSVIITADIECGTTTTEGKSSPPRPPNSKSSEVSGTREGDDAIEFLGQDIIEVDQTKGTVRNRRQAATKAVRKWSTEDDDDDDNDADDPFASSHNKQKTKNSTTANSPDEESDLSLDSSPSESEDDWADSDEFSSKKKSTNRNSKVKSKKQESKPTSKRISADKSRKQKPVNDVLQEADNLAQEKTLPSKSPASKQPQGKVMAAVSSSLKTSFKQVSSASNEKTTTPSQKKTIHYGMPRLSGSAGLSGSSKSPSSTSRTSSSSSVSSPSGGLRLGLSRKANVKPLHPSVNNVH